MPKIKKLQFGNYMPKKTSLTDMYSDQFINNIIKDFQANLNKPVPSMNFKNSILGYDETMNTKITSPTYDGLGSNLFTNSSGTGSLSAPPNTESFLNKFKKNNPNFLNKVPDAIGAGLESLGISKADTTGAGEELAMQGLNTVGKGLVQYGGPVGMAVGAGMLAFETLNKYGGKKNNEQKSIGMDIKGYTADISTNAGKKNSFIGTYGLAAASPLGFLASKTKLGKKLLGNTKLQNTNKETAKVDRSNLLKANVTYSDNRNQLAAQNSDTLNRNGMQLSGKFNSRVLSARDGVKLKEQFSKIIEKAQQGTKLPFEDSEDGKKFNVIPEGALHARLNNYEGELAEQVTSKGIPVITYEEGDKIVQHAEIENSEIIFHKTTTEQLEEWFKEYNDTDDKSVKKELELKCGKFLTVEILENTIDNMNII